MQYFFFAIDPGLFSLQVSGVYWPSPQTLDSDLWIKWLTLLFLVTETPWPPKMSSAAGVSTLGRASPPQALHCPFLATTTTTTSCTSCCKVAHSSSWSPVELRAEGDSSTQARDGNRLDLCCKVLLVGLLAVWPWTSSSISLGFTFLVCWKGIITVPTIQGFYADQLCTICEAIWIVPGI